MVSPAEHCANPRDAKVERTEVLANVFQAVYSLRDDLDAPALGWIPLIDALQWAESHSDEGPSRKGTQWADELLSKLRQPTAAK